MRQLVFREVKRRVARDLWRTRLILGPIRARGGGPVPEMMNKKKIKKGK